MPPKIRGWIRHIPVPPRDARAGHQANLPCSAKARARYLAPARSHPLEVSIRAVQPSVLVHAPPHALCEVLPKTAPAIVEKKLCPAAHALQLRLEKRPRPHFPQQGRVQIAVLL